MRVVIFKWICLTTNTKSFSKGLVAFTIHEKNLYKNLTISCKQKPRYVMYLNSDDDDFYDSSYCNSCVECSFYFSVLRCKHGFCNRYIYDLHMNCAEKIPVCPICKKTLYDDV